MSPTPHPLHRPLLIAGVAATLAVGAIAAGGWLPGAGVSLPGVPAQTREAGPAFDAVAVLRAAQDAQQIGDYDTAVRGYEAITQQAPDAPEAAEAAYQLGVLSATTDDHAAAVQRFTTLLERYPSSGRSSLAGYWLAQSLLAQGDTASALARLEAFAKAEPATEAYVRLQRVRILAKASDDAAVLRELAVIDGLTASPQVRAQADRQYADGLLAAGRPAEAADRYRALLTTATPGARLGLLSSLAAAQGQAGRPAERQQALAEIARTYPSAPAGLNALNALGNAAVAVLTPYQIGRVHYFQRQNDQALAWFQRQVAQPPTAETPWARYRTALVYERYDRNEQALAELAALADDFPTSDAAEDALWERAGLLTALNRQDEAKAAYQEFRRRFPRVQRTTDALLAEGLSLYRSGDYRGAAASLATAGQTLTGDAAARTQFWRGKALAAGGDQARAQQAYAAAERAAPGAYYGFRANGATTATRGYQPLTNTAATPSDDAAAKAWLARWLPDPAAAITDAHTRLAADPAFSRAGLLTQMGQWDAAVEEYQNGVRGYKADLPALYALATRLHTEGQHAAAMLAVAYLQDMTAAKTPRDLPRLLQMVLYPTPFLTQVQAASQQDGVDPALAYALMKQESLFNPQATSGADARGLTQVMPSTGAEIAAGLGVDGFVVGDLYRPTISIRFGSYYLAKQLAALGQNPVFALAAYNGGAGSALQWMGNNRQIDPDLFVENIDYDETRAYVLLVMENYAYYRSLYG